MDVSFRCMPTREELEKVYAGDIAAAIGFKFTTTGDTICDERHPVILESMEFPDPVIDIAIEPKTKASQGKMGNLLKSLQKKTRHSVLIRIMRLDRPSSPVWGELHLEIIVDRLLREFKVEANVGKPQVAYKETFTKPVDVDSKYAKQSGGRGQYGHCKVKFEPMDANAEETYKFINCCCRRCYPEGVHPGSRRRYRRGLKSGILAGFPVLGVKATVYDGSYHEVDSSEMAFHIAGSMAFKEAMKKARSSSSRAYHEG